MSTLVRFVLLALTWGSSFLLIKVGLEGMSPGQVVLFRLAFGALALVVLSAMSRTWVPRDRRVWGHLAVVGVLLCTIPFFLFVWAETQISSSLASIFNATTPLMTTLFSVAFLAEEKMSRARVVGLALGFLGVVVLVAPWSHGLGGSVLGQLACLLATACYGAAFTYMRRFVTPLGLTPLVVATGQVLMGFAAMLLLAPFTALGPTTLSAKVVLAVAVLGAVGTGLAYVWNTRIVAEWGATNASAVTYLTPVVGVALLGEPLTWTEPVGALLVILGIAVLQGRLKVPGV